MRLSNVSKFSTMKQSVSSDVFTGGWSRGAEGRFRSYEVLVPGGRLKLLPNQEFRLQRHFFLGNWNQLKARVRVCLDKKILRKLWHLMNGLSDEALVVFEIRQTFLDKG